MIPPISIELRSHQIEAYKKILQAFGAWEGEEDNFGQHEHRVIAEQEIGRALGDGEIVHRIDGGIRNNPPQSEHAESHFGSQKAGDAI